MPEQLTANDRAIDGGAIELRAFTQGNSGTVGADADGPLSPSEVATLLDALSDGLLQHGLLDRNAVRGLFGKVVALLLETRRR